MGQYDNRRFHYTYTYAHTHKKKKGCELGSKHVSPCSVKKKKKEHMTEKRGLRTAMRRFGWKKKCSQHFTKCRDRRKGLSTMLISFLPSL